LLNEVVRNFQFIAPTHQIILKGKCRNSIVCDQGRIKQVIINLLSNAVKYSAANTKVIVQVNQKAEDVIISVADQGIGIPRQSREKIFDLYYRVNEQNQQGFGLGLYISSEIINRHSGRIWVETNKGEGSTFFITLPKAGGN
jgi:signal transduction histidine kinase